MTINDFEGSTTVTHGSSTVSYGLRECKYRVFSDLNLIGFNQVPCL